MIGEFDSNAGNAAAFSTGAAAASSAPTAAMPSSTAGDSFSVVAIPPMLRRSRMVAVERPAVDFRGVRALMFDMGGVFYDATLWRRWLLQLLSRMGLHTNYRSFYRVWQRDFLDPVHRGEREHNEALRAFLRAAGLKRGQIDEVEAASQARRRELEMGIRPLPGVRSTLKRLHAEGATLGVLCNAETPAHGLSERLTALGLDGLFKAVVSSFDLRRTKPDAECYFAALEAMQQTAAVTAFVGHDGSELAGAAAVGLRTVAFNADAGAVADRAIGPFEELWDLVNSPGAAPVNCGAAPLSAGESLGHWAAGDRASGSS
jgi:HAD superfamily hydrolase (TIGR01509 family)